MLCPAHMLGYLLTIRLALSGTHLSGFRCFESREAPKSAAGRILGLNPVCYHPPAL
jgi:hypothetical protein